MKFDILPPLDLPTGRTEMETITATARMIKFLKRIPSPVSNTSTGRKSSGRGRSAAKRKTPPKPPIPRSVNVTDNVLPKKMPKKKSESLRRRIFATDSAAAAEEET